MGSIDSKAEMLPNHPAVAGGPRWQGGAAASALSPGSSGAVSSWEAAVVGQV